MSRYKSWGFKGQANKIREDRGGRMLTVLAATSIFGVELLMIIEGSVDSPTWCYFISEI
jgi:hypothetical protein